MLENDDSGTRIEEYKSLREEILTHIQISNQYSLTTVLASGAIFGFAIENESPLLFLAALAIIVPNTFNFVARVETLFRIGTYLQVFHESTDARLGWETRYGGLGPEHGLSRWGSHLNRLLSTLGYLGLGVTAFALFVRYSEDHGPTFWTLTAIAFLSLVLVLIAELRILRSDSTRGRYLQLWQECLARERGHGTSAPAEHH
jgi:hypothetical protein